MRHSLPVLNQLDPVDRIEIPIPCTVGWDTMVGDERVRHCRECRQNVYNIASMSRPEALRLLETTGGQVCVRIFRRPDGTVVTADCRERLRAARKRGIHVFLAVLVVVICTQIAAQLADLFGTRQIAEGLRGAPALAGEPVRPPIALTGTPPIYEIEGKIAPMPLAGKPAVKKAHRMGRGRPIAGGIRPTPESRGKVSMDSDLQGLLSL